MNVLEPYADFFIINVSSLNTPGLRDLQSGGLIVKILTGVTNWSNEHTKKPVLVKIGIFQMNK